MIDSENKKPDDMADDSVLSGDGVNPIAHDEELDMAYNSWEDNVGIFFPGDIPPAYFPGYPGGPSIS